jgi:hypothetical protein
MYVCVCICMYMYVYVCICMYMYICTAPKALKFQRAQQAFQQFAFPEFRALRQVGAAEEEEAAAAGDAAVRAILSQKVLRTVALLDLRVVKILRALTFAKLKQAQEQAHEAKLALERHFFDAMTAGVNKKILLLCDGKALL